MVALRCEKDSCTEILTQFFSFFHTTLKKTKKGKEKKVYMIEFGLPLIIVVHIEWHFTGWDFDYFIESCCSSCEKSGCCLLYLFIYFVMFLGVQCSFVYC